MNPDRAAHVLHALLMTPAGELNQFPQRLGLGGRPQAVELEQVKEILHVLLVALDSGLGPNWQPVATMWGTLRAQHGEQPQTAATGPSRPEWVRTAPARPSLNDPAPGTAAHQQRLQELARFVPRAPQAAPHPASAAMAPPAARSPQASQPGGPAPATHGHLPFNQAATGAPAAPTAASAPARSAPPPPPRRSGSVPEGAADSAPLQESVARYAALCAACAADPKRVFATLIEYGVSSPEERAELDALWQDRFDDDAALQERWEELFRQFRR